jgi:outer membrane lipoprotein SlyB
MDPFGTIANMAAVGAVVGSAIALVEGDKNLAAHITWGSVAGGMLGLWQVLLEGLWS